MAIPYYAETENNKILYELANLTLDNIEKGVNSTILSTIPAYILPDNSLYYTTWNHHNSNFYREIRECFEIIAISSIKPKIELFDSNKHMIGKSGRNKHFYIYNGEIFLEEPNIFNLTNDEYKLICDYFGKELKYNDIVKSDSFHEDNTFFLYEKSRMNQVQRFVINYNTKEELEIRKKGLLNIKNDITNNGLLASDVHNFLNYNCLSFSDYAKYSNTTNLYSKNCEKLILAIIESKIQVYSYFIEILKSDEYGITLLNSLENHPMKDYWKSKYDHKKAEEKNPIGLPIINYDDKLEFLKDSYCIQDFAVQTLGFDKVETQSSRTITTSKESIYEPFFNYLIMDYSINQIPKIKYNNYKNTFEVINRNEFVEYSSERELEEEIQLIKKYIPYNKRNQYFK